MEMQAASLFAFAHARAAIVAIVALVSNGVDQVTEQFDTGGHAFRADVLAAIARAAHAFMTPPTERHTAEETRRLWSCRRHRRIIRRFPVRVA